MMSRGVDGLITNKPDVARLAVKRRAAMSDAQRILVALLVRAGASTESLDGRGCARTVKARIFQPAQFQLVAVFFLRFWYRRVKRMNGLKPIYHWTNLWQHLMDKY